MQTSGIVLALGGFVVFLKIISYGLLNLRLNLARSGVTLPLVVRQAAAKPELREVAPAGDPMGSLLSAHFAMQ